MSPMADLLIERGVKAMRMCRKSALSVLIIVIQILSLIMPLALNASAQRRGERRPVSPARNIMTTTDNRGLLFRLSEGADVSERPQMVPQAPATKLSDAETESILRRLQPIKTEAD